jgi:hypothetical protein
MKLLEEAEAYKKYEADISEFGVIIKSKSKLDLLLVLLLAVMLFRWLLNKLERRDSNISWDPILIKMHFRLYSE